MRHIPTTGPDGPSGDEGRKQGPPLAAMRTFHGPNLVILSRAKDPPVPRLRREDEKEEARDVGASAGLDETGTKRELRGLSAKSSLNLSRVLSILDWKKNGICIHVSLTYGRYKYPKGKEELAREKSDLSTYLGRAGFCGIWRLEFQSRESDAEKEARYAAKQRRSKGQGGSLKVPHWHILLWIGTQDPVERERWLVAWWQRFSGNHSPYAIKVTSGDQARGAWYLAKHHAKSEQAPPFAVGRWWGYINRDRVLEASDLSCNGVIEERSRIWWARLYKRATGAKVRNACGLSWFLPAKWQTRVGEWIIERVDFERITKHHGGTPF